MAQRFSFPFLTKLFELKSDSFFHLGKITCVENHPSRPTNESDRSIHLELKLRDAVCEEQKEIEYLIMKSPGVSLFTTWTLILIDLKRFDS